MPFFMDPPVPQCFFNKRGQCSKGKDCLFLHLDPKNVNAMPAQQDTAEESTPRGDVEAKAKAKDKVEAKAKGKTSWVQRQNGAKYHVPVFSSSWVK